MRIALFGATGQLGTALRQTFARETVLAVDHSSVDIADEPIVRGTLGSLRPDLVINAAAYNFVDKAEDEPDRAHAVNALGPKNLAVVSAELNVPLVYVSTDYVFGQDFRRRTPYSEIDSPGPLGVYAASKLAGEQSVAEHTPRHYIVRTCGLYGQAVSPGKGNFVETMLRLGRERGELAVVDDQTCTPTSAVDLAEAIGRLIHTDRFGLYHATNSGEMTWYTFAREIFRLAKIDVRLNPITTAQYPTKARRPAYSVLGTAKLENVIGRPLPPWPVALAAYLRQRGFDVGP